MKFIKFGIYLSFLAGTISVLSGCTISADTRPGYYYYPRGYYYYDEYDYFPSYYYSSYYYPYYYNYPAYYSYPNIGVSISTPYRGYYYRY